jgi:ribosomal protein S18 acetylase RimI-like enzyme
MLDDPEHDPRYSLAVRDGDRLLGAAIGVMRTRPEGQVGHVRFFAVDPIARRRGIASALLSELEARLASDGAAHLDVGAELPIWLFAGVDVRYTQALCLLERRDYVRQAETCNLSVDLVHGCFDTGAQENALREKGFLFRRMEASDRDALDFYLASRWSETWRYEGLSALAATPPTGFLALKDDHIVGFAAYDIMRPGWFGPIGTDQELRGLGIGTVLLLKCFRDLQLTGRREAEVSWIGPLYFYVTAANARICRVLVQFRKAVSQPHGFQ